MDSAETFRKRADNAERWARECREKMTYKPESRAAYESQHDRALAEMFFNDALARAAASTPNDLMREMERFRTKISTTHISSTAIDHERFLDYLKFLVRGFVERPDGEAARA